MVRVVTMVHMIFVTGMRVRIGPTRLADRVVGAVGGVVRRIPSRVASRRGSLCCAISSRRRWVAGGAEGHRQVVVFFSYAPTAMGTYSPYSPSPLRRLFLPRPAHRPDRLGTQLVHRGHEDLLLRRCLTPVQLLLSREVIRAVC